MIDTDAFVGLVAVGLGLAVVFAAGSNHHAYTSFWLIRSATGRFGPVAARLLAFLAGISMAGIGTWLLLIGTNQ